MKKMLWVVVLTGLLGAPAVRAEDGPPHRMMPPGQGPGQEMREIEMRHHAVDLQTQEEKLRFQREMDNLQIAQRQIEVENARKTLASPPQAGCPMQHWKGHRGHPLGVLFLFLVPICLVVHVLLAIWVYQDLRRRNASSGIWIAVTLLIGIPGAAIYCLSRIGDRLGPDKTGPAAG